MDTAEVEVLGFHVEALGEGWRLEKGVGTEGGVASGAVEVREVSMGVGFINTMVMEGMGIGGGSRGTRGVVGGGGGRVKGH